MFRVKEAARLLGLSLSKTYELIDQGKIGHHRMDGAIRISQGQIDEYLNATEHGRRELKPIKQQPRRPRVELKHL